MREWVVLVVVTSTNRKVVHGILETILIHVIRKTRKVVGKASANLQTLVHQGMLQSSEVTSAHIYSQFIIYYYKVLMVLR